MHPRNPRNPGINPGNIPDPNDSNFMPFLNNMQVPSPGYMPWPQDMGGYGGAPPTPTSMFDGHSLEDLANMTQVDVETVQETQPDVGPSIKRRPHRKRVSGEPRQKVTQLAWSQEEQLALCRAWLDVTEDPKAANYQKDKTYWRRITEKFHKILKKEPYRDQDVVSSKWRKMRPVIQSFNQIFHRLSEKKNHLSGASDADLQNMALAEHQGLGGPPFQYVQEWTMLRRSSKFLEIIVQNVKQTRGEPTVKRSKSTSSADPNSASGSDARINIDLNETDDDEAEEEAPRYIRPSGRDAAKKAARAGSSSSGLAPYSEDFALFGERIDGLLNIGKQRVDLGKEKLRLKKEKDERERERERREKDKELQDDLKILNTDYSSYTGVQRQLAEQLKQRIMEKYGFTS